MRRELIVGWPKSGTTALFFKVADSLPAELVQKVFEPKSAGEIVEQDGKTHLIVKALITAIGFTEFKAFSHFDRKIWILRDPRDFLISRLLYSLYTLGANDAKARHVIQLVERKRLLSNELTLSDFLKELEVIDQDLARAVSPQAIARRLQQTVSFLGEYGHQLYLFRYEDMIDQQWESLEAYLGRRIRREQRVPARWDHVVRTKAYGGWRHWFLCEDVQSYRKAMDPFLEFAGYETDWNIAEPKEIQESDSTEYVTRIIDKERARLGLDPIGAAEMRRVSASDGQGGT